MDLRARFPGSMAVLLALAAGAALADDAVVRAFLDRTEISAGEEITLSIEIAALSLDQAAPPDISRLEGFDVITGPSVSSRFQWINGRTSASRTYSYVLRPDGTGTLTIPALGVLVQGRTYRTRPITLTVNPPGTIRSPYAPPPVAGPQPGRSIPPSTPAPGTGRAAGAGADVRVRVEADARTVYVGQQVTVRFLLDTQTDILNLALKDNPTFPGFWAEEIKLPENLDMKRVQIGADSFVEYTLMKRALFPTSPGQQTIPPVTYQVQVRRRSSDPIESFFFTPTETVTRRSDPIAITVLPLPAESRPPGFSGAVGSFNVSLAADRTEARVNDAIGVKFRITGEGNLNAVTASPLPELNDFKQFAPKVNASTSLQADRFRGEKVWDYVLIPLAAGTQTIPPVAFTFFDPVARAYRTVRSEPVSIQVARGEGGVGPSLPSVSQSDVRLLRRDVHYLKLARGGLEDWSRPFHTSPVFMALILLPVVADLGAALYARRRDASTASTRLRRERRARRVARKRLNEARRRMSPATARAFYAAVAQALTGYVGDKFDASGAGLTHQRIEELLAAHGAPEEKRSAFHRCLEACDYARFAPSSSGPDEMRKALAAAEETLVGLERTLSA